MDFNEYVASLGINPETLSVEHRTDLQNAWRTRNRTAESSSVESQIYACADGWASKDPGGAGRYRALAAKAVSENWTFQRADLELLRASREGSPMLYHPGGPSAGSGGNRTSRGTGTPADLLTCSLMLRGGHPEAAVRAFGEMTTQMASDLRLNSLVDAARYSLQISGQHDIPNSSDAIVKAALMSGPSTYSFSHAIGDAVGRTLAAEYSVQPASWRSFAAVKFVQDFREKVSIRASYFASLDEVADGGKVKHATANDAEVFTYSVSTFANVFSVTRKTIINDDLGILDALPLSFARSASRKLSTLVYSVMAANANSFWGSGNSNYLSGGTSPLSVTALGLAIQKLREQRSTSGDYLALEPTVLLVPPSLEVVGRQILTSTLVNQTAAQTPTGNPFFGAGLSLVVEPRLGATEWFVFGPKSAESVVVSFLQGAEQPTIQSFDMTTDPESLEMSWRVLHDFGCALGDPLGSVKSAGA